MTGRGGVGKSTAALACLQAGLDYLADDYVIVRHDPRPTVYSLYSTAKLDPGQLSRFPALRPFVHNADNLRDEKAVLFLYPHFRAQIQREMPLKAIVSPVIADGADTRFRPEASAVVRQAASFTTMAQLPCVGRHTHEFIGRLCSVLPGYTVQLGHDLQRIPPAITRLVQDHARRPRGPTPALGASTARHAPLVSVVIPVYNGECFLRDAVESVLIQRYPSVEIIVVDDGSTDGTGALVPQLPCDVRYFKQENTGAAAARNRGIRDTTGDLIAFLDVDDLWPENNLRMLVDEMLRHPQLDVVHGYAQLLVYDSVAETYEYRGSPIESFPYYVGAALYRKRVFGEVGLFDPTMLLGEDVDWFNRANELKIPMKRLEAVTLHVRRHGRNMTHGKNLVALNTLRVFRKALDRRRVAGRGGERASA
jgi:GT2 family glycosyltransferase